MPPSRTEISLELPDPNMHLRIRKIQRRRVGGNHPARQSRNEAATPRRTGIGGVWRAVARAHSGRCRSGFGSSHPRSRRAGAGARSTVAARWGRPDVGESGGSCAMLDRSNSTSCALFAPDLLNSLGTETLSRRIHLAKPGPQTQAKRNRERKKREKRQKKAEQRAQRSEEKGQNPQRDPSGEDPDIAGIVPGPQPPRF